MVTNSIAIGATISKKEFGPRAMKRSWCFFRDVVLLMLRERPKFLYLIDSPVKIRRGIDKKINLGFSVFL